MHYTAFVPANKVSAPLMNWPHANCLEIQMHGNKRFLLKTISQHIHTHTHTGIFDAHLRGQDHELADRGLLETECLMYPNLDLLRVVV